MDLGSLSTEEKLELLKLLETRDRRHRENWLEAYKPYAKQREFHEAGQTFRERLFMAGNQLGKTFAGAAELAIHATGRYPPDWKGRVFKRPTRWIAASASAELTRRGVQRLLIGTPENESEYGTGAIPKECIAGWSKKPGVPDALASVRVRNEYGGESVIQFGSYEQGREKFQADTLDGVWMDEEPPLEVYSEAVTRTAATGGLVYITFTPLLGMSQVVKRFLQERPAGTTVIKMGIADAEHFTPEERAARIAAYPEHERMARANGDPMLGSGAVFPIAQSEIQCEPIPLPAYWARVGGMDMGIDHPAAFVVLAHDRDSDTVYVIDAWKTKGKPVGEQALMIVGKGYGKMPWAWPHDALQRDRVAGVQMVKHFKDYGVNTLAERAQFAPTTEGKPGGNSVEAGYAEMLNRMQTRRLRVFSHLNDWFEEMRMLHRKDGQVVKLDDDLMSATRYALMMLRKAQTPAEYDPSKSFSQAWERVPSFGVLDASVNY